MKPTLRLSLFCILLITTTLLSCKKETPLPDMAEIQSFTVVIGQDEQRQIVEGVIDGKNITLVVPSAESTTILTPSIETTPGSRVSPASGKPINFASPQIYSVQKGETVQVYTVTAIFEPKPPVAKNTYKFFFLEVTKDCLFAAYDILTDTKSSIYILAIQEEHSIQDFCQEMYCFMTRPHKKVVNHMPTRRYITK